MYSKGITADEALSQSFERLNKYGETILNQSDKYHEIEKSKLREVIETLRAENARYREALAQIVIHDSDECTSFTAREALKGGE